MTQIKKFKNVKELISFFECGGEGVEEWLLKNEVINSIYSEEVLLDGNPVIAVFDARRYFYDDNKCDVVEDDEITEDCIEMITLKFKSLTTLDNRPIDIQNLKNLEKKNQIINELGKLTEETVGQQLSTHDIEKLTSIVNELNSAINQSQSHINKA